MYTDRYAAEVNLQIAQRLVEHAKTCGTSPVTLATARGMTHPSVTAPIIGARALEQLESSLAPPDTDMPPERQEVLTALPLDPPLATDRAEEAR